MDLKSVMAKLGRDADELMEDYLKVAGTLSKLGLNEYEARAYVALVVLGSSTPSLVSELGQIPRTSAYRVLEGLVKRGFAREKEGRPRSFVPVPPSELSDRFVAEVEDAFGKLDTVKDILSERGVPQLVYTIMGKDRVLDKIGEMIDKAETSFVISSPSFPEVRRRLSKRFQAAASRGVEVTVITKPFVKVPKAFTAVRRNALIATDVISDGTAALLASSDLNACGFTDNATLAAHLADFLRTMSERAD
ncbi:MAG: TrmB family transcriptional regulator [Thermoplasmata archaeon]|jgi:sugar-specific transcriptional regulator TrmB|nr:TrmB family transcriptional regulator [Thermoplasmata archaeon]